MNDHGRKTAEACGGCKIVARRTELLDYYHRDARVARFCSMHNGYLLGSYIATAPELQVGTIR